MDLCSYLPKDLILTVQNYVSQLVWTEQIKTVSKEYHQLYYEDLGVLQRYDSSHEFNYRCGWCDEIPIYNFTKGQGPVARLPLRYYYSRA